MQAAVPRFPFQPVRAGSLPGRTGAVLALMLLLGASPAVAQEPEHHSARKPVHDAAHGKAPAHHATAHPAAHPSAHPAHPAPAHHAAHRAPPVLAPPAAPRPPAPVAAPVPATPPAPAKGASTGLPLPRFASLRADAVNLRGGPGTRYPIQWVYKRRDLPVRIEREFDVWRLVEDSDGVKGWVHQATLMGTRTFVIPGGPGSDGTSAPAASDTAAPDAVGQVHNLGSSSTPTVAGRLDSATGVLPAGSVALRAQPQPDGSLVAVLMPGIVGRIRSCSAGAGWCKVSVRDYSGWLPRSAFWGLLPDETILPP